VRVVCGSSESGGLSPGSIPYRVSTLRAMDRISSPQKIFFKSPRGYFKFMTSLELKGDSYLLSTYTINKSIDVNKVIYATGKCSGSAN
jgi:hypothetical protein